MSWSPSVDVATTMLSAPSRTRAVQWEQYGANMRSTLPEAGCEHTGQCGKIGL
jgi:hypothetical protein